MCVEPVLHFAWIMGIDIKKNSQTEQQTYKGESRKSLLEIFFTPCDWIVGLLDCSWKKDQTKCFPRSIVSPETWRFISSLALGAIKAAERKDNILRVALKAGCVNNIKAPVCIVLLWDRQSICQ